MQMMQQIFNERSVLFLGCDPERPEYKNFFEKFAVHSKVLLFFHIHSVSNNFMAPL